MLKSKRIASMMFGVLTLASAAFLFVGLTQGSVWGIFAGIFLLAIGVSGVLVLVQQTRSLTGKHLLSNRLLIARIMFTIMLVTSVVIVLVAGLNGILWGIIGGVFLLAIALGGVFVVTRETDLR